MKLHLIDINLELVEAWQDAFDGEDVDIQRCDILNVARNTIVSPANSYGYMDGGIDRIYTEYFGLRPQTELQERIARREEGYLPVGASILVNTGNEKIPYMIAAPTMMSPGAVPPENCFFAMSAVLKTAANNRKLVSDVYCPGLATLIGEVNPKSAATEMANAYKKWRARENA